MSKRDVELSDAISNNFCCDQSLVRRAKETILLLTARDQLPVICGLQRQRVCCHPLQKRERDLLSLPISFALVGGKTLLGKKSVGICCTEVSSSTYTGILYRLKGIKQHIT